MQAGDMNTMKKCSTCGELYSGDLCPKCLASFAQTSTRPTAPPDELPLKPGQVFHGLEIMELLGKGGMGVVFKARQPALDRLIALKILPQKMAQDPDFQSRFIREAKALGSLNHPNIVAIYDFGAENGLFFFAMEYVDGTNLRNVLRDKSLSSEQALKIVPQLCDALEYAHTEGIVHRDIKPENILLDKKGRVKIADFGLAKLVGADAPLNLTVTNMVMGTPHYMAPEQVENPKSVDHRADIYAIGVVLYEMLTGELPIGRFELPSTKVRIDVRLDEVVIKTLEKSPDRRYQKAGDVKDAVTKATTVAPVQEAYAKTVLTPTPRRKKTHYYWVGFFLFLFIVIGIGVPTLMSALKSGPAAPPSIATVTPPPAAGPLDLTPLHFGPEERPARYIFAQIDKTLPRNPFPAREKTEIEQLCKILDEIGLQNVSPDEVRQGYVSAWFRWSAAMIALETPIAARLETRFAGLKNLANKWSHRNGQMLVLAWTPRAQARELFHDLVARLQKKLGLPLVTPDVPLENLKLDRSDLPSNWQFQETAVAAPSKPGLKEHYQASFEPVEGSGQIEVRAWLAETPQAAEVFVAAKLDLQDRRKVEVLRAGRSVVGVALRGDDFGAFTKTVIKFRSTMGLPEKRFEDLRPGPVELPAGFTIDREETQPAKVLQDIAAQGILVSEVRRASLLRLKPAGMIVLLEVTDSTPRSKLEEQLRKSGPAWSNEDWVFGVEGPDDETLDALENRMRELFGWDRNRPRPATLINARLQETELPAGWSLGPAKTDRLSYLGELRGPGGPLRYEIFESRDYKVFDAKVAALPVKAGDLLITKDTVACCISGGGEASWPVLEALETVLRKKLRLGAPKPADFEIEAGLLPAGASLMNRKDLGFVPNPQELKGTAAVKKLLDSKLGADLTGAVGAWAAFVDPGETLVAILQAADEAGARALAERVAAVPGAKHQSVLRKGVFVGVTRSNRQDDAEFLALGEVLRAKLRLPK